MMKLNICSWNVRGLGKEEKWWVVKDLVRRWKVNVFSLQETKLQFINRKMRRDLWGRCSFDCIHKPTVGRSGRILVAWESLVLEMVEHRIWEVSVSV